ncbi:OmpA family protein [Hyphomicrobium facile]|uniref:Outer membrane protein OmpA n=1 Tax=Hyphomicrobium facile TaxID=51670 RepID=A0A1I7MUM9_9HYPH|nr:OmpA family protein [Hyphomicrobium facile]SFV26104.1 Outer membrane protein OmpA [Hyphomicrobium facile]
MRARLLFVLILLLLGGFVALAQVGFLTWPVELAVTLHVGMPEKWRPAAGADAATPKATAPRSAEANAPRPPLNSETPATTAANETAAAEAQSSETATKKNSDAPALTIARISSIGPSVFGGTAAPFARVTVLEGSTPIGTATANDRGDWSIVTEYRFANSSPDISLRVEANPENATASASEPLKAVPSPQPTTSSHEPPATQLLKKFEGVVAAAREEAKHQDATGAPSAKVSEQGGLANVQPSRPPEPPANQSSATQPLLSPSPPSAPESTSQAPASRITATTMPVPITFVYNEATLTPEGHSAAHLLLEFLMLKKFAAVILSGHADERGLPAYNMELSRERLVAIERVLRNGGYQGKLELVPKGANEPFTGVDRSKYTAEELYQLDRRVELRVAN